MSIRKVLAVACVLLMSGCAEVNQAANDAADTLAHPPQALLDSIRLALGWIVDTLMSVVGGFFLSLLDKIGL